MEFLLYAFNIITIGLLVFFYSQNRKKHKILYRELRQINRTQKDDFKQLQHIVYLAKVLDLKTVLPEIRTEWSIYPDLASLIIQKINLLQPKLIMELGSGSSTVILGYCLKQQKRGKLISLEHEEVFYEKTKELIEMHELTDYVTLIYTPFVKTEIDNFNGVWYDTSRLDNIDKIDILLVDGPPGFLQKNSRYPALPLLFNHLKDEALIIADDCNRKDEQEIINMWCKKYNFMSIKKIDTETGTYLMQLEK